jgi:hypothetical protein
MASVPSTRGPIVEHDRAMIQCSSLIGCLGPDLRYYYEPTILDSSCSSVVTRSIAVGRPACSVFVQSVHHLLLSRSCQVRSRQSRIEHSPEHFRFQRLVNILLTCYLLPRRHQCWREITSANLSGIRCKFGADVRAKPQSSRRQTAKDENDSQSSETIYVQ